MLSYLFTSSLLLFIFALGYFVFLRQSPALPLRRRVLLFGLMGILFLPLFPAPSLDWLVGEVPNPVAQIESWQQENALAQLPQPFDLTVEQGETMEEAIYQLAVERQPFWEDPFELAMVLYGLGVFFLLLRLGSGLFRLVRLHRRSTSTGAGDIRILAGGGEAFTFGATVYLSQAVYDSPDLEVILTHERAHAAQWHTFDALLAEVMRALFWFHPMAWWLREQVQLNLEYLADAAVLAAGYEKKDYQLSLVAHQQGVDFRTSLLPQFAAKGLKRRIQMMSFRAGSQVRSWVVTAGLVLVALVAFTVTNGKAQSVDTNNQAGDTTVPNTNFDVLYDGEPHELNIYFKRLPFPAEVAMIREELKYFYNRDFSVFQDCTDQAGTFTFGISTPNQVTHQVKFAAGEETTLPWRIQINKDGKGGSGGAVFRPQPLPEGAPDTDIFYRLDGAWVSVEITPDSPYTAKDLNAPPLPVAINCQLGLTPNNHGDFNIGKISTVTPIANSTPEEYVNSYIKGYEEGSGATTTGVKYFLSEKEVDWQEFYRQAIAPNQLLTLARRMGRDETLFVARLDPARVIGQ